MAGDLLISMPQEKVVVAIDILAPDWVPIMDLDITTDIFGYMNIFDRILGLDFDAFIGGHSGRRRVRYRPGRGPPLRRGRRDGLRR